MAVKSLTLSFPHPNNNPNERDPQNNPMYRIEKVIGSIAYVPHQYLTKKEVADLCDKTVWSVTMVPSRTGG